MHFLMVIFRNAVPWKTDYVYSKRDWHFPGLWNFLAIELQDDL